MITKVRINNDKMYNLDRWNWADFSSSMSLVIESIDLQDIRDTFEHISKIEIIKNDEIVAVYTSFDTFANISYMGKVFFEDSQRFSDAMRVELSKTNIIDQVQRLQEDIHPVIDVNSMTLEELRTYKLEQVAEACRQDIYDGDVITLENGSQERFTYNAEDQENIFSLLALIIVCPDIDALPWHSTGMCRMYSRRDLITICSTLLLRKTQLITYCNSLNMYIRNLNDREALLDVQYGQELKGEYSQNIATVMGLTITEMEKFMRQVLGRDDEPDEPTEPEEPEDPEEPTEPEEDLVVPEE